MTNQKQMLGGCGVCLDESGWKENPLVYCDGTGCDVAVHKNCYGITKVPSGPWYCQKCVSKETGDQVRCCLCPKLKGVLKRTDDNRWAHVLCALYIPEIRFGNVLTMEPIIVAGIPASSFNSKPCYICEDNENPDKECGVCLQCFKPSCKAIFHVTCAQSENLLTEEAGTERDSVQYCGYCAQHSKKGNNKPRNSVPNSPGTNGQGKNTAGDANANSGNSSDDKRDFSTPLTVEIAEKPKPRSRARASNGGAKRTRKPAAKKGAAAAAALAKLSPQLKSPLRSPLRSPLLRSPATLLSPGRSTISLVSSTAQGLLEQHFELGKKMLESQAPLDIAQLLTCISKIQQENEQLELELNSLTARRDHLVSINARLTLPNNSSTAAVSTAADDLTVDNLTSQSFPSHLVNGSISSTTQTMESKSSIASLSMSAMQPGVTTSIPLDMTSSTGVSNRLTNKKSSSAANGSKESASTSQARKRSSESVIKMNSKQPKQSTPPTVKPSAAPPPPRGSTLYKTSAVDSHFQWPGPLPPGPLPPVAVSASTVCRSSSSASSLDSVSSRLPPINALSQARPASVSAASSHPVSVAHYLNMNPSAAATLASYPRGQAATLANYSSGPAAALAGYGSYTQFPMFSMPGLTGLAMQGLHAGQPYYRPPTDAAAAGSHGPNPNGSIQ